jgi:hypothetical protein
MDGRSSAQDALAGGAVLISCPNQSAPVVVLTPVVVLIPVIRCMKSKLALWVRPEELRARVDAFVMENMVRRSMLRSMAADVSVSR